MSTFRSLTIVAALFAGGTSVVMAQNGLPTGGEPPVAGGAAGNPSVPGPETLGYIPAPEYPAVPGYVPGYAPAPGSGYAPGYAGAPGYFVTTQHGSVYMYAPTRSTHVHKKAKGTNVQ